MITQLSDNLIILIIALSFLTVLAVIDMVGDVLKKNKEDSK